MKKTGLIKIGIVGILCLSMVGCMTIPKGFLKPSEKSLENRQLQMRQYDTKDETKIITSVAGVLQDLGFTLDDSETDLGLVVASKKADAVSGGQMTVAFICDVLAAAGGTYSNNMAQCDKEQKVRASVIVQPSLDGSKIVVRVTFQRIVWNMSNQISRVETIIEPQIYEKFYEALSKAIFLEAEKI